MYRTKKYRRNDCSVCHRNDEGAIRQQIFAEMEKLKINAE